MDPRLKARMPLLIAAGLGTVILAVLAAVLVHIHRPPNLWTPIGFIAGLAIFWLWRRLSPKA